MNVKKIAFNLGVASLFATSAPSFAVDGKVFPGAMCQPINATEAAQLVASDIRLHNNSTTRQAFVVCPLVRDNLTNTNGTKDVKINVYRNPSYAVAKFSCTLYSRTETGNYVESDSGFFNGFGKGYIGLDVDKSSKYGNYTVRCSIPRKSNLYNAVMLEH